MFWIVHWRLSRKATLKVFNKLMQINLARNKIEMIDENEFRDNTRLEFLGLDNNKIKFLSKNVFTSLIDLKKLYLYNNEIQFVSPKLFYWSDRS
jgi:Leucine-rich repeat (LRR) protein